MITLRSCQIKLFERNYWNNSIWTSRLYLFLNNFLNYTIKVLRLKSVIFKTGEKVKSFLKMSRAFVLSQTLSLSLSLSWTRLPSLINSIFLFGNTHQYEQFPWFCSLRIPKWFLLDYFGSAKFQSAVSLDSKVLCKAPWWNSRWNRRKIVCWPVEVNVSRLSLLEN